MDIRHARIDELDQIMNIYVHAKKFMDEHGNEKQWAGSNGVTPEKISKMISDDTLYVGEEDGILHFVFAYIQGEDPTYKVITDGAWINDNYYGTIHRLASNGTTKGVVNIVTKWALERLSSLRIDTHHDNVVMQNALAKEGFTRCGIIYLENGDPRIAYQKVKI